MKYTESKARNLEKKFKNLFDITRNHQKDRKFLLSKRKACLSYMLGVDKKIRRKEKSGYSI